MKTRKQKCSSKINLILISVASFITINLVGCGGGGGEESVPPPPTFSNTPSIAISANAAPDNYNFEQFKNYQLEIDMPKLIIAPVDHYYVVKIFDIEKNTYLLELQKEPKKIEFSASISRNIKSLMLEVYSADLEFVTIKQEIIL